MGGLLWFIIVLLPLRSILRFTAWGIYGGAIIWAVFIDVFFACHV